MISFATGPGPSWLAEWVLYSLVAERMVSRSAACALPSSRSARWRGRKFRRDQPAPDRLRGCLEVVEMARHDLLLGRDGRQPGATDATHHRVIDLDGYGDGAEALR
ncbi:hypothetical protein D9M69_706820 [compost metagenome]